MAADKKSRKQRKELARQLQSANPGFLLKQEMEMYDTYQRRIAECDQELEAT
jgi:hypothetical protein